MIRRSLLVSGLISVALTIGGVTTGVLPGLGNAAAATVPGVWHKPEQVPGIAKLNVGRESQLSVVSCSAAGECAGSGSYLDGAGHFQAFVVAEHKGVWGSAQEIPGSAALNTGGHLVPNAISCASPGNCAVGGDYTDGSGNIQAWVADEVGGVWGKAQELPGTAALNTGGSAMVNAISCAKPGYCAAGGGYSVSVTSGPVADPFVASEVNGTWSAAIQVAGTANYATLTSVSCGSAGDCVAGGGDAGSAYIVMETSGTWGSAQLVAGTAALAGDQPQVTSISCESSGCDAVGMTGAFLGEGFGITETGGTWGSAWATASALPLPVPVPSGDIGALQTQSLSCTSPGNCSAAGFYGIFTSALASVDQEGFIAAESGGTWDAPQTVPSLAALDSDHTGSIPSVSCPAPGYCAAVALYAGPDAETGAVLSEVKGTWETAQPLSDTSAEIVGQSISCGAIAYCSVGGGFSATGQYYQAIVVDETPVLSTRIIEKLSAARVTYGHEQAEKVSVTVSAALGQVTGKVTVTAGRTRVCVLTLKRASGSCRLRARTLRAGSYQVRAIYRGNADFKTSVSARKRLTVR